MQQAKHKVNGNHFTIPFLPGKVTSSFFFLFLFYLFKCPVFKFMDASTSCLCYWVDNQKIDGNHPSFNLNALRGGKGMGKYEFDIYSKYWKLRHFFTFSTSFFNPLSINLVLVYRFSTYFDGVANKPYPHTSIILYVLSFLCSSLLYQQLLIIFFSCRHFVTLLPMMLCRFVCKHMAILM